MGLGCTRFAGPAGLQDTGNASCAYDLAALARADLANDWVASVTGRRSAEVPFPTKGGTLSLANNHYFAQRGIAGVPRAEVTGLKTGLTNGAGPLLRDHGAARQAPPWGRAAGLSRPAAPGAAAAARRLPAPRRRR